jgi:hypothetical protein
MSLSREKITIEGRSDVEEEYLLKITMFRRLLLQLSLLFRQEQFRNLSDSIFW